MFQTKKNSPDHIKRPMNAFMVFSHHERKKVIQEDPNIHNTSISKELGKRWNSLAAKEREPFVREADRLKEYHMRQFPSYKYRPAKKKTRIDLMEENRELKEQKSPRGGMTSILTSSVSANTWTTSKDRIKISTGGTQRDVLKHINTNRLTTKITINRSFRNANRSVRGAGGVLTGLALGAGEVACEPSPPPKVPTSPSWPTTPDPHSSPFYRDSREGAKHLQYSPSPDTVQAVPLSPLITRSCPITPISRPAPPALPHATARAPSPLFPDWELPCTSLPDLASFDFMQDMFPASASTDLSLDVGDLTMLETAPAALPPASSLPSLPTALEEQELGTIDFGLMEYIH